MKSPAPFSYTMLQTPCDAILAWLDMVAQKGYGQHGIIFTRSEKDADCYLKAADRVMPPHAVRHRTFHGPVAFEVSGSTLTIEILRRSNDHLSYMATRQFLCFDNPTGWSDENAIVLLKNRVSGPTTHIVAVGSHITWNPTEESKEKAAGTVDFFAITRAVSG